MKPTRLQWEDVIQFEEVKGYGQHVWRDGNHLYYVDEEGGIAPQRVVYEFPLELFQLLKSGEKTLKEIHFKLKKDCWPPNVRQEDANKNFFRQFPEALTKGTAAGKKFRNADNVLPTTD